MSTVSGETGDVVRVDDPVQAGNARKMLTAVSRMLKGEETHGSLKKKGWDESDIINVEKLTGMTVDEFVGVSRTELQGILLDWLGRMSAVLPEMDARMLPKAGDTLWKVYREMEELKGKVGGIIDVQEVEMVKPGNVYGVLTGKGGDDGGKKEETDKA